MLQKYIGLHPWKLQKYSVFDLSAENLTMHFLFLLQ